MSSENGLIKADIKDLFGAGELVKNGAEAFVTVVPGRKIVSSARAQIKIESLLDEELRYLTNTAQREGWSEEFLAMRVQGFIENLGRKANLDAIVGYAKEALGGGDSINEETVHPIDSEWLNYFIDHAERVTDEDVRMAWGAILSGEVNNPGSFSKRAISTLATMGRLDIESFRKLCRYLISVEGDKLLALERDEGGATYNDGGISYDELSELSAWGLVNLHGEVSVRLDPKPGCVCASDESVFVRIFGRGGKDDEVRFPIFLTRIGRELASMCDERDISAIVRFLKKRASVEVLSLDLLEEEGAGSFESTLGDGLENRKPRAAGLDGHDVARVVTNDEIDSMFE